MGTRLGYIKSYKSWACDGAVTGFGQTGPYKCAQVLEHLPKRSAGFQTLLEKMATTLPNLDLPME